MITRIFTLTVVSMLALAAISEACGRRGRGSGGGCSSGGCSSGGCSTGVSYGGGGCSSGGCSTGNCANGQCGYVPASMLNYSGGPTPSYIPASALISGATGCGMPGCICVGGNCPADCAANGCTCGMLSAAATASGLMKVKVCDNLTCRIATVPVSATACQWKPVPNAPTQVAKYVGGVQVGSYDESSMIFRDYNAATQTWGKETSYAAEQPKATPPASGAKPASTTTPATGSTATPETEAKATGAVIGTVAGTDLQDWQTRGVGWVPPKQNTVWENGVKTLEAKVLGGGSDVPDLSKRSRIVVVDEDAVRGKSIAKDLAASKRGANSDVQYFPPGAWQIKPWKLDQDETFRNTHLAMLELGPVESDGRGAAIHAEYTPEGIVRFGRKADPEFRLSCVPTSETAGMDDAWTIFAAIGVIAALAFAALWPQKPPVTEQTEVVSWSY